MSYVRSHNPHGNDRDVQAFVFVAGLREDERLIAKGRARREIHPDTGRPDPIFEGMAKDDWIRDMEAHIKLSHTKRAALEENDRLHRGRRMPEGDEIFDGWAKTAWLRIQEEHVAELHSRYRQVEEACKHEDENKMRHRRKASYDIDL
eukprot:1439400-Prymnesium_polylepis.1